MSYLHSSYETVSNTMRGELPIVLLRRICNIPVIINSGKNFIAYTISLIELAMDSK